MTDKTKQKDIREERIKRREARQRLERAKYIAAFIAIAAKKGIDGTTIVEVADAMDRSRGIVHTYFESKDRLINDAIASVLSKVSHQESLSKSESAFLVLAFARTQYDTDARKLFKHFGLAASIKIEKKEQSNDQ